MLEYNMTKLYYSLHSKLLSLYTALKLFECSVFFKQIKFNQFKFKILRVVNFCFNVYSLNFSKNISEI